ncbi:hypothetical protein WM40_15495 [Robbsia andropogonis]|uniref:2-succinyl-5-enolpyruvyl-6-hydroxy-3-cyclohexene-1-carboxylate synthase n=1 Tax=Robbsia andropogonis TaxID=28092 RepID=A0A0F5JYM3_9BURK|nr:thiamine pyrophosphate-binding protein [Robbsia andropogonis]KKB62709.1 hypothetical protein WM40_15495 [Robbsia andropogonis]
MNARRPELPVALSAHAANARWATVLIDVLHAYGVRRAILSPGGRSAALMLAMRASGRFSDLMVCNDERSGAFAAVGMLKVSPEPVVMVTTSGSAIANTVPALTEALECGLPLVLVSCDRPRAMRGAGFGQMTDHIGACAAFVRHSVDLPDPCDDDAWGKGDDAMHQAPDDDVLSLSGLHAAIALALSAATGRDGRNHPGPVHINMPLAGRYDPTEIMLAEVVRPTGQTAPSTGSPRSALAAESALERRRGDRSSPTERAKSAYVDVHGEAPILPLHIEALCHAVHQAIAAGNRREPNEEGVRGLVVAGPDIGLPYQAVLHFAATLGWPVLADTGSGLRGGEHVVNGHDALALSALVPTVAPDMIIRLGLAPVMPIVQDYLLATHCPTIKITPVPVARDFLHPDMTEWVLPRDQADALLAIFADRVATVLGPPRSAWRTQWLRAAQHAGVLRKRTLRPFPWGELSAMQVIFSAPVTRHFDFIHIGNSMPIRHADLMFGGALEHAMPIYTNRGVCGIDGTIGTFLGEVVAHGRCAADQVSDGQVRDADHAAGAGLLVLGDQSFLHDLPALSNAQRITTPACICVMNNAGGAIFDFLPLARLPDYQQVIRNPTSVNICAVASGFGLAHRTVRSLTALSSALTDASRHGGVTIIDVCVPAHSAVLGMRQLGSALEAANHGLLKQQTTEPHMNPTQSIAQAVVPL